MVGIGTGYIPRLATRNQETGALPKRSSETNVQVIDLKKEGVRAAPDHTATKTDQFIQKYRIPIIAAIWILALGVAAITAYSLGGAHQDAIGIAFLPLLGISLTGHAILHFLGKQAEEQEHLNQAAIVEQGRKEARANRLIESMRAYRINPKDQAALAELHKRQFENRDEFARELENLQVRDSIKKRQIREVEGREVEAMVEEPFARSIGQGAKYFALRDFDENSGGRSFSFEKDLDSLVDNGSLSPEKAFSILALSENLANAHGDTTYRFDQRLLTFFNSDPQDLTFKLISELYLLRNENNRDKNTHYDHFSKMIHEAEFDFSPEEILIVKQLFLHSDTRADFERQLTKQNFSGETQYLFLKAYDHANGTRSHRRMGIDILVERNKLTPAQAQREILHINRNKTPFYEKTFSEAFTTEK